MYSKLEKNQKTKNACLLLDMFKNMLHFNGQVELQKKFPNLFAFPWNICECFERFKSTNGFWVYLFCFLKHKMK